MSELEITRVVLYKTGLGFFEKRGKIDLSQQKSVKISFKNTTMNDLLKTFSIMRVRGDLLIAGVSYEGQNTNINKLLEDCIIRLPESDTLYTLINQLRGFEVKLISNKNEVSGVIVGLQARQEPVSDKNTGVITELYVILRLSDGKINTFKIKELKSLEIVDPIAKKDFNFFMDVVQSSKSEKYRNVTIYFQGTEPSEYILTFLQELPAFKVSWRIYILDDVDEKDKKEKDMTEIPILLYGFAIIDNILNEDWNSVQLSLMSGLPISFKYDSYSPLYISRPEISRTADLSINQSSMGSIDTGAYKRKPKESSESADLGGKAEDPLAIVNNIVSSSKVKGSGYEYKIPMRVTVKRNQSSLIPIVQNKLKAKMVSVYNENVDTKHPMSTLEFKNTTDLVLEEGPISIFKDDVFQGEAMLPFMEKDEQQRIPYAINQSIEVTTETKQKQNQIHKVQMKSYIEGFYYTEMQKIYTITNIADFQQILIVEHPKSSGYELFDSEKPAEDTANYNRFRIELEPQETKKLVLKERKILTHYEYYENIGQGIIDNWFKLNLISEVEYGKLIKLIEYRNQIAQLNKNIQEIEEKRNLISTEQARIRENMKTMTKLESENKLRNRYVSKFEAGEQELDKFEKEIEAIKKKISEIDQKYKEYIKTTFLS